MATGTELPPLLLAAYGLRLIVHCSRKHGEYGFGGIHLVAHARHGARPGRQVDIHPRAEPDEAETLTTREALADPRVAKYAPCDQSRDLNAGNVGAGRRPDPQRCALVLERGFRERGIEELAQMVPGVADLSVHRAAVRMDVEDVHEHANLDSVAL